ncbi:MAG: aminotransferase class V-fold PLP-dependent enzyme [Coriobacteriia bacterium]|nr:aminotransferase class V-fold PLP-dependent enzyme [Coriobacteriia bacterium]
MEPTAQTDVQPKAQPPEQTDAWQLSEQRLQGLERLRADFPALTAQPGAYLDNAATTHKPQIVLDSVSGFYRDFNANPYRSQHRAAKQATELYEGCRRVVADHIGASSQEVIFTRNTTESLNLLAYAWGLHELKAGDRIVLPIYEHHSNLVPWQFVAQQTGAELAFMYPNEAGQITAAEVERVVTAKTKLISCAQVSNVYASASPVGLLVEAAKSVGARVFLDCAQSVAHLPLRLHDLDVDAAAFSGHKAYAPMGIGVLYVRAELLEQMRPFLYGGEMIDQVYEQESSYLEGPRRFEAGTPNVAGAFGLAVAIDYLQVLGFQTVAEIEAALMGQLLKGLAGIAGLEVIGSLDPADRAGSLVSFYYPLLNTADVAFELDASGFAVRAGTHCTQPLHRFLKLPTSLRVSPCFYNTPDEIAGFLEALNEVPARISRRVISSLP